MYYLKSQGLDKRPRIQLSANVGAVHTLVCKAPDDTTYFFATANRIGYHDGAGRLVHVGDDARLAGVSVCADT